MLNAAGGNGRPSTPMAPNAFSQGQALSSGSRDYARPTCNTTNANPPAPDRRTISAVIVNCRADNVRGRSTVHVIAYLDLFLIAPAVSQTIYGEAIGAYITCAVLVIICGMTGSFERLVKRIPSSLAAAPAPRQAERGPKSSYA